MPNEADTCRKHVVPKLQSAGWDSDPHLITEQRSITDGRIVPVGKGFMRKPPKRVDYLLCYERNLALAVVEANRRDVIATVFKGVQNRMVSGYLLRDVVNKVAAIHFTASDELHTLGSLYESMLREMRDAAGDSGEFYTPRAVVRFIVKATIRASASACSTPPPAPAASWSNRSSTCAPSARPCSSTARCRRPPSTAASPSRCPTCSGR